MSLVTKDGDLLVASPRRTAGSPPKSAASGEPVKALGCCVGSCGKHRKMEESAGTVALGGEGAYLFVCSGGRDGLLIPWP